MAANSQPSRSERALDLAQLWERIDRFCIERGWDAELYVRHDFGTNFGRVGAVVDQGAGLSFRAFGDTTESAVRNLVLSLEREGFGV